MWNPLNWRFLAFSTPRHPDVMFGSERRMRYLPLSRSFSLVIDFPLIDEAKTCSQDNEIWNQPDISRHAMFNTSDLRSQISDARCLKPDSVGLSHPVIPFRLQILEINGLNEPLSWTVGCRVLRNLGWWWVAWDRSGVFLLCYHRGNLADAGCLFRKEGRKEGRKDMDLEKHRLFLLGQCKGDFM